MEIPCDQPFGLFSRHTCRVDEKHIESNTEDDDDEDIVSKKLASETSSLRTRRIYEMQHIYNLKTRFLCRFRKITRRHTS
jgi:hypothetical protein